MVLSALQLTGSNRVPSFPKSSTRSAASFPFGLLHIIRFDHTCTQVMCTPVYYHLLNVFLLCFILCFYLEAPYRSSTPVTQRQQSCPAKEKGSNLRIKNELESFCHSWGQTSFLKRVVFWRKQRVVITVTKHHGNGDKPA